MLLSELLLAYCQLDSWTYLSEIGIKIQQFSLRKIALKMSLQRKRPFCLGLNMMTPMFLNVISLISFK